MLDEGAEEDEAEDDAAEGGDKGGEGKPSSGVDMSEGIEALHAVANLTLAWIGDQERVAPEPLLSTACILHDLLFDLQVTLARLVGVWVGRLARPRAGVPLAPPPPQPLPPSRSVRTFRTPTCRVWRVWLSKRPFPRFARRGGRTSGTN